MVPYLIIAGAEKAGTTSLYGYLAAHPQVCPSLRKETDYFRQAGATAEGYLAQFPGAQADKRLRMESSPGYLAEAETVAPRLAAALPQARLVFVLREPVERLRSCYRFYQSRLHVPSTMDFDTFVTICLDREAGSARDGGLSRWHLLAAARGRYERALPAFERVFPASQCLVLPYERLRNDAPGVTREIARFAGLEPAFFDDFAFARENVSFRARHGGLQRVAVAINDSLEPLWRRHPSLKRRVLGWYKHVNAERLREDALSEAVHERLEAYYRPTRDYLTQRFAVA
jgi:hypothetical protein